jgi:hypothetical protein
VLFLVNEDHFAILKKGIEAWNQWRDQNPLIKPDLGEADLFREDLRRINLSGAHLDGADLIAADLSGADLSRANLIGADLSGARMIRVKLEGTNLSGCRVFGVSAWGLIGLENSIQEDLKITPKSEPDILVGDLEIAQFIYILRYNEKIRKVIDAITSKVVLIIGRFTPERKAVLDAIRVELRNRNYLPIIFDFPEPKNRNLTETVSTLAHLARFVIADITDAKSIPQELTAIIPILPSVPVQPILYAPTVEYGMFKDFNAYPWLLKIHRYNNIDDLLKSLEEKVIAPSEAKATQLIEERKNTG